MKTIIIYHRVDWDGYTAAAVALRAFPKADLLGWNHKDRIPNVSAYNIVVLVDLTISDKGDYTWMHENADKLIWIDHHAAAIGAVNRPDIRGLRRTDIGACVLTWEYFFPTQLVRDHVALCGSYDVFRKDGGYADWDHVWDYCLWLDQFGSGWTLEEGDRSQMLVKKASQLINETEGQIAQHIVDAAPLEAIRAAQEEELFATKAEEFTFRGYKAFKLYAQGRPAAMMRTHMDKMACIVFQFPYQTEDGTWKASIRVSETCPLDANLIANEYGGGGHPKAAGCSMTEDDIDRLSSVFVPMWEYNSCFPTIFLSLEEAREDARTWEYPCDDLGNWDEDEIEIFEMILTKPLPKNRMLRKIDLPEYGRIIHKHYTF